MCGRYVITHSLAEIMVQFSATPSGLMPQAWTGTRNASPGMNLPIIRRDGRGQARLSFVKWGLVPHWAKEDSTTRPLINARLETAHEKASFRQAFERRRALVPAQSYYEWSDHNGIKQPYEITRQEGSGLVFAGLWERWGQGEDRFDSFAILTTSAPSDIAHIHPRSPVLVEPHQYTHWLAGEGQIEDVLTRPGAGFFLAQEMDLEQQKILRPLRDGALTQAPLFG